MQASDSEAEEGLPPFGNTDEEDEDEVDLEVGDGALLGFGGAAALGDGGAPRSLLPAAQPACTAKPHTALDRCPAAMLCWSTSDVLQVFSDDEDVVRDTTAVQLAAGRDIQGIPWELTQYSRQGYRVR